MKQYSKEDPEYRGNGHYLIDGIEYMSVWTYKKKKDMPNNSNSMNGAEAIKLSTNGVKSMRSKPDFGNFDNIYIYPVSRFEEFLSKNKKIKIEYHE
jgi:hypothetical protein